MEVKNDIVYGDYKFNFHSYRVPRPIQGAANEVVKATRCVIRKSGEMIAQADVVRNNKDQDNKVKAREFAVRKAISSIEDREVRTDIWNNINQ